MNFVEIDKLIINNIPEFSDYINNLHSFLIDYPNIGIRWPENLMPKTSYSSLNCLNDYTIKTAIATELLFDKNKFCNPKDVYRLHKYKFDNDEFYRADTFIYQKLIHKYGTVSVFFRIKNDIIYNVYSQICIETIMKRFLNYNFENLLYFENYKTQSILFKLPDDEKLIFYIGDEMKYLINHPDFYAVDIIMKFMGIHENIKYLSFDNCQKMIRRKLLKNYYNLIPERLYDLIY